MDWLELNVITVDFVEFLILDVISKPNDLEKNMKYKSIFIIYISAYLAQRPLGVQTVPEGQEEQVGPPWYTLLPIKLPAGP